MVTIAGGFTILNPSKVYQL